jgi:methionyl-tRNA synthetase
MKNFYVTTPIYYPTGTPHIGTAYTTLIADTLARYNRLRGNDTFFLTGTDEHGANIAKKASEERLEPQQYVNKAAEEFKKLWKELHISNDFFIQTTNPLHKEFAQNFIQRIYDNGDLYPAEYEGLYCESCEAYYTEEDLVDGKCPNHPTKTPIFTKEKNYYFKWSKYQDWLLDFYETHPEFVQPQKWYDYVKDFVKKGLKDIPFTRANVKWGIPVPFDPEQTIYVWSDALANYLSVLHFPENAAKDYYNKFWNEAIHVVGKDIIKFHAILWPAMLKSAGYEFPKTVLVHGFFTVNGQKIGKSNNNAINPIELAEKYGIDAVKYALLSEFKLGNDGDFSLERLQVKYDNDLGANWGNLHNRIHHLAGKYGITNENLADISDDTLRHELQNADTQYNLHFARLELFEAIQTVNALAAFGNKYLTEQKPWEKPEAEAKIIVNDFVHLIKKLAELYTPFLPEAGEKAVKSLETGEKVILFPKLEI